MKKAIAKGMAGSRTSHPKGPKNSAASRGPNSDGWLKGLKGVTKKKGKC